MRDVRYMCLTIGFGCACVGGAHAQFADVVQPSWYRPAPGQHVNDPLFNDPTLALGAPVGGGLSAPGNTSIVSLGGFGGELVLGFSQRVMDDPCNPMGLDAIVFGNAFYVNGNETRRWGEPGTIEISLDENGNGEPDDAWYLVRFPGLAQVPQTNVGSVTWDDDAGTALPPANIDWYPASAPSGTMTTGGVLLGAPFTSLVVENSDDTIEDFRGLADMTPTLALGGAGPSVLYTTPDNPYVVGVDEDSGGGDAFDIAWAVDVATGAPAHMEGFDFIRVRTGPDVVTPIFGEVSTEIDAVSDVTPDPLSFDQTGDGVLDAEDVYRWHDAPTDVNGDTAMDATDGALLVRCVRVGEVVP